MFVDQLFSRLWTGYAAITPQAARVHELLEARGESVRNDHVALRTFGLEPVHIEVVDRAFVDAGYQPAESYEFPDKHLVATHYEHAERSLPKVFISALCVEELSDAAQRHIADLVAQLPPGATAQAYFAASGRHWELSWDTYTALRAESEYAAWVAAFGFCANHFTVDVNELSTFENLAQLCEFLESNGLSLSAAGGKIKGSPQVYLEQSSTIADEIEVGFSDGDHQIPSCYYEFARRYETPDGSLFQGFVTQSAKHLFDSTSAR